MSLVPFFGTIRAVQYNPTIVSNFNGHTYALFDESMLWTDAKVYCESIGGYLVGITSQNEQDFINQLVQNGHKNLYWIGLYASNNDWMWVNSAPFIYSNWGAGEPNEDFGGTENVVQIYAKSYNDFGQGEWNDSRNNSGTMSFYQLIKLRTYLTCQELAVQLRPPLKSSRIYNKPTKTL